MMLKIAEHIQYNLNLTNQDLTFHHPSETPNDKQYVTPGNVCRYG